MIENLNYITMDVTLTASNLIYAFLQNLNEVLESVGAPVEIRDGCVSSISVEIPWSSLLTANSKVEIKGLEITLQPKYRLETPGEGIGFIDF